MTSQAKKAFGTQIKRKTETDTWEGVAELTDITGPSMEADEIDVTSHDSEGGYREYVQGLKDAGEIEAELFFLKDEPSHMKALDDFNAGDNEMYRMIFPDADEEEDRSYFEFEAFVNGFEIEAEMEEAIKASVSWKVSGKPTFEAGSEGGAE
ncbi:phage tail tube protein [Alkalicoccus chagannorensis]|uniref:phage tail tube protein n=1 Tax=Alkalicoccus chagannorensis TaxID=427072 RepID=UPI000418CC45|nr:phage tail tube protein [Alkalicoccus chagannorensis]